MKKLRVLFPFLFVGIILGSGYYVWKSNQTNNDIERVKKSPRFSIQKAPINSEKGTIQSMSGTIKWSSRTAIATEGTQITKPVPIQQGEELMTGQEGSVSIHYQSGLIISLSPNSHLSFVQMLPTNFVLNQLKGTIEYQKNNSIPLAIRSLHLLTQLDNEQVYKIHDGETLWSLAKRFYSNGYDWTYIANRNNISDPFNIPSGRILLIPSLSSKYAKTKNGEIQIVIDEKKLRIYITVKQGSAKIAFNDQQNVSNLISLYEGDRYLFDDEKRQGNVVTGR